MKYTGADSEAAKKRNEGVCGGYQSLHSLDCGHGGSERLLQNSGGSERLLQNSGGSERLLQNPHSPIGGDFGRRPQRDKLPNGHGNFPAIQHK